MYRIIGSKKRRYKIVSWEAEVVRLTVYLDELFLINAVVDYLILLVSSKICALPVKRLRLGIAAAAGGIYAALSAVPGAEFLKNPLMIIAAGVLLCVAAYGGAGGMLRMTLTFFAIAAVFGGFVMAVSLLLGQGGYLRVNLKLLAAAFIVCYVIVSLIFKRSGRREGEIVKISVTYEGRTVVINALVDTGNSLSDPVTGQPVIVAGVTAVAGLFEAGDRDKLMSLGRKSPVEVFEELGKRGAGFRLIPYSAVGIAGGMLIAFRPDKIVVNGKKELTGALVALSPNNVSDGGAYAALAPAVL